MKKIVIAVPYYASWVEPLRNAFKKIGFQILEVDYRFLRGNLKMDKYLPRLLFYSLITMMLKLFKPQLAQHYQRRVLNKFVIDKTLEFNADYFLGIKGENLTPGTINKLKKNNIVTICWMVDYMFRPEVWSWFKKIGPHYDVVLQNEIGLLKKISKLKWSNKQILMLFAADPQMKNRTASKKRKYDVVFVGTYNKEREKYFKQIRDLGLNIWGYQWEKSSLNDIYKGSLSYSELLNIYGQSKIVIANNQSPYAPFTNRIFEASLSGALVVHQYNEYIGKVFKIDKDVICYDNPKQLKEVIEYYLAHPTMRRKMSTRLTNLILKHHTYDERFREVFAQIERKSRGRVN